MAKQLDQSTQSMDTDVTSMTELVVSKYFDLLRIIIAREGLAAGADELAGPFDITS